MADEIINGTPSVEPQPEQSEATPSLADLQAQLESLRSENAKLKNAQSSASADASKYKKALQDRMTEQERAAAETKELIERLRAENEAMKKNQTVAEHTAGFLGLGLGDDLARQAAEATSEGNFASLITTMKAFLTEHDKVVVADQMRSTPRPGVGSSDKTITKEEFNKMKYAERVKLLNEQPDLYNQLTKKE